MSELPGQSARRAPQPESGSEPSCAVLVMSCDAYRDLWTPFFNLFRSNWPDCPFPVFLGTNFATFDAPCVTTLKGGELEWSGRLRNCLERTDREYVLLLLEDFFLDSPVLTGKILSNLRALHELDGVVLRLCPRPGPTAALPSHAEIGMLERFAPYRVSTQAALWKRTALLSLLQDAESIWQFEWNGTARSEAMFDGFYCSYHPVLRYRHVVERGQWFRSEAGYFSRQEIGCDFSARSVMSPQRAMKKTVNRWRKNLLNLVLPLRLQVRT